MFFGLKDKSGLIIVSPASFLIFLLTLPLAPLGLLRLPAILRFLYLALRLWRLLNTRCRPRLLPLFLDCRASLLRRGIDRGWFLYLALRLWSLLHTLCSARLLPLILDYRASLLRRGFDRGWSLNIFATPLLWLRACGGRSTLLGRL